MVMTNPTTTLKQTAGVSAPARPIRIQKQPVRTIESHLDAGEGQLAARAFLAAVANDKLPGGLGLNEWLQGLSEQHYGKLIAAFAQYPCFACRNGQESCDTCGGSGFSAAARVCSPCAGFGEKRCDFCSGSGLAAYSVMPIELWPKVITTRAKRAMHYLKKLAAQPVPNAETAMTRRLSDMNKLLGVLENAVAAARQLEASEATGPDAAAQFNGFCRPHVAAGMQAMQETLAALSRHCRQAASTLPPVDAENAMAKSEFYEDLAGSATFAETGLSHPFLLDDPDNL